MVDLAQSLLQSPPVQFAPLLVVQLPPQLLNAGVALVLRLFHVHLHLSQDVRDLHDGVSGRGIGCQAKGRGGRWRRTVASWGGSRLSAPHCARAGWRRRDWTGVYGGYRRPPGRLWWLVLVIVVILDVTDGDGGKLLSLRPLPKSVGRSTLDLPARLVPSKLNLEGVRVFGLNMVVELAMPVLAVWLGHRNLRQCGQ